MSPDIPQFIHRLATATPPPHCANPYEYKRPYTQERRQNLEIYLRWMIRQQPRLLLIGEAPGYRGCRLSGIPFTSRHILSQLACDEPFQPVAEWPALRREASATIVWRTIGSWAPLPLLWNVFPFHPHRADHPQSNRTPSNGEIDLGRPFLNQLLHIFPQAQPVAVGKKAAAALQKWGVEHTAVRHPSHGGAQQFKIAVNQLR